MIVQCEQCDKKFKLNPDLIKDSGVRVRCSNCLHVFKVEPPKPVEATPAPLISQEMESPPASRPRSGSRLLFFLIPLLLVAGGFALWLYLPWPLHQKPVSKSTGVEQLQLLETRGYFVDNQRVGQLFVIQGRVRNDFSSPRRWIHLRAKLYTSDGQTARQLDFYAGTIISDKKLRSMSLQDLLALINKPPSAQEGGRIIPAQQEVSFTVPFGDLPELTKLSDYSVEILASQPA